MSSKKRVADSSPAPDSPVASGTGSLPVCTDPLPAIVQMARGIVHDFNNALSPVLGYTELLLEDPQFTGKQRQCLERLEAGALRALDILRRLDLSYRETHDQELAPVRVADLIREVAAPESLDLLPAGVSAAARCRLELDDSLYVQADAAEIRVLLAQLLANALEAATDSTSEIVLRWYRHATGSCLEINDRGAGMSPEMLRVCHEPFQSTKSDVGAGLGLSMCHGIVRRLAGSLRIDSELGSGTTVRVVLPAGAKAKTVDQI